MAERFAAAIWNWCVDYDRDKIRKKSLSGMTGEALGIAW